VCRTGRSGLAPRRKAGHYVVMGANLGIDPGQMSARVSTRRVGLMSTARVRVCAAAVPARNAHEAFESRSTRPVYALVAPWDNE